jgi:hypothetical protein
MIRARVWILVLAAAAGSCRDRDRGFDLAQAEDLPGFHVAVPAGKPFKAERNAAAGELIYRERNAVLAISWQSGRVLEADLPQFADATARALGVVLDTTNVDRRHLQLVPPDYGFAVKFTKDDVRLELTMVQCARSNVTVTLASVGRVDHHARLVASLRCGTEAEAQSTAVGLPEFDHGDDVAYLPGSDPPAYYSVGGAGWIVTPGTSGVRKAVTNAAAVREMFGAMGIEVRSQERLPYAGPADWVHQELAVVIAGEPGTLLLGSLACPGGAEFMVLYAHDDPGEKPAARHLERVRCPASPVDPTRLPTVQARLGAACDAGNGAVCVTLADLVEQEPALLAGLDAAALRERACKLGVADACP